ncbi:hypothetical protein ACPCHQ_11820 [Ralstonia thomasii]|jgi:hypothetical protein|uniref:Uncharacterized protein n=2 Tax=Ralstonia TaxID=48736 RepID=A0ABM9JFA5_9RALS|nr:MULTISPECIES: hypothetical protein [Ralstonia]CAJ0710604.1 hypothetical protein LMG7143_01643 [Ralstonia sp. LMG 18095]CAJ0792186.1 hypothetical protein LMG18095_02279 [Ralstonia sp. LMG 18095]
MLEIDNTLVKILHINTRNEKHGDEKVLGVDLKLQVKLSNDELAQFSPTLKASFYHKDEAVQGDLVTDAGHLPNLKNPQLGAIKWAGDYENQRLEIHHGVRAQDDIVLSDIRVNKFVLDMKEGGTVFVTFRAQIHPDEKQTAKILTLLDQEVHMSLVFEEPPEMREAA